MVGSCATESQRYPDRCSGTVINRARVQGVLRANLDFRMFPFDSQNLPIHVESFAWSADPATPGHGGDFLGGVLDVG